MKKFKFTLQNVLNLKENIQENEKMLLLDLKAQYNNLLNELELLNSSYEDCAERKRDTLIKGTTSAELYSLIQYISELNKQIKAKQDEIENLLIKIDKQTDIVKEINTEVKTLEKLKEKQLQDYNEKANKESEIMIEEFIVSKVS